MRLGRQSHFAAHRIVGTDIGAFHLVAAAPVQQDLCALGHHIKQNKADFNVENEINNINTPNIVLLLNELSLNKFITSGIETPCILISLMGFLSIHSFIF